MNKYEFRAIRWCVLCVAMSGMGGGWASGQQYYGNQTRNVTVGDVLSGRSQVPASSVQPAGYEEPASLQPAPVQVYPTRYETAPSPAPSVVSPTVAPTVAPPASYPVRQVAYEENAGEVQRASEPQSTAGPRGDLAQMPKNQILAFSERVTLREGTFQMLTIIDPEKKSVCVYHVNIETGQIELKCARKLEWDLELIYLNSKKPLPNEVQTLLQTSGRR